MHINQLLIKVYDQKNICIIPTILYLIYFLIIDFAGVI